MLHLLCMGRVALTSVAGGAALSYNQLAEALEGHQDLRLTRRAGPSGMLELPAGVT